MHLLDHKSLLKRGPLFCSKPYHPENAEDNLLQSYHLTEKLRTPHGLEPWPSPIFVISAKDNSSLKIATVSAVFKVYVSSSWQLHTDMPSPASGCIHIGRLKALYKCTPLSQ